MSACRKLPAIFQNGWLTLPFYPQLLLHHAHASIWCSTWSYQRLDTGVQCNATVTFICIPHITQAFFIYLIFTSVEFWLGLGWVGFSRQYFSVKPWLSWNSLSL